MEGTALVLGSNGQDGSYLVETLLARGYSVVGAARQPQSRWVADPRFLHAQLDLRDERALRALLRESKPLRVFALAAVHGSAGYEYETDWRAAIDVNVSSIHTCLEYIRQESIETRLFLASSSKVFGPELRGDIDEEHPRKASCLYSITKIAAEDALNYYRERHNVWASIGYFFNHDSPRRPPDYFLPRLCEQLAAHLNKDRAPPSLETLDFWCDWGASAEFMRVTADLLELERPADVIVATGVTTYAGTLVDELSDLAGVEGPAWARSRHPAQRQGHRVLPPYRARTDKLRALVSPPESLSIDVARQILAANFKSYI